MLKFTTAAVVAASMLLGPAFAAETDTTQPPAGATTQEGVPAKHAKAPHHYRHHYAVHHMRHHGSAKHMTSSKTMKHTTGASTQTKPGIGRAQEKSGQSGY